MTPAPFDDEASARDEAIRLEVEIFYDARALATIHLDECHKYSRLARAAKARRARVQFLRHAMRHYLLSHRALDVLSQSARRLARLLDARLPRV